jgi:hypothetical protein
MGYGCTPRHIKSGTVLGYLTVINAYYVEMGIHPPFVAKSKTKTARLLADTKKFELEPDRREPLSDKTFDKMHDFARLGPFTGFKSLVWDIAALGRYGGFRQQEYAMDHKTKVKYFVTPAGQIARAFTMENILFRDKDRMIIRDALLRPDLVEAVGTRYMIQKNRRNGQVIWYSRDVANPSFCPVIRALSLVRRAVILGQSPTNPVCVYRDTTDDTVYLTGAAITEYFRYVTKLVYPDIDAAALAAISSHSLRVTACVLLAEAGMPVYFIKLRLRWISDCFEVYIRNTLRMAKLHNVAITNKAPTALSSANLGPNLPSTDEGDEFLDDYELEDDD